VLEKKACGEQVSIFGVHAHVHGVHIESTTHLRFNGSCSLSNRRGVVGGRNVKEHELLNLR
jgi:hypothetical protein